MEKSPVGKNTLIIVTTVSLTIAAILFLASKLDKTTTIVFCDVGQGDGAYIRVRNTIDILIDAGPDKKILTCLGKYMPFYDRTIELAILSHPQKDHYYGFLYLLDRYSVKSFIMVKIDNTSQSFKNLKSKIRSKYIPVSFAKKNTKLRLLNDSIFFYWPSEMFLKNRSIIDKKYDPIFRQTSSNQNEFSAILAFEEGNFKALFTGDAPALVLDRLLEQTKIKSTILKIPHHGSKNGLTKEFLKLADPTTAVISAGKNNRYGHPAKEILDLLRAQKVEIRRTDIEGDIVFKIQNSNIENTQ